jgi:hypothetical protein
MGEFLGKRPAMPSIVKFQRTCYMCGKPITFGPESKECCSATCRTYRSMLNRLRRELAAGVWKDCPACLRELEVRRQR